jgi:glycerol uptake facilitator-like aquaporin
VKRIGGAFPIGILPIALAFDLTVTAMAYAVGHVSGAQLNPAVTEALWTVGRIRTEDLAGYIIAQLVGGIAGGRLAGQVEVARHLTAIATCSRRSAPARDASSGRSSVTAR